mmetsp:Transcript_24497/g.33770  ORF Transcript_24497/g.33770 Transcript_24497/m.33770 type:complete len:395 (+) Transcript_24497:105-1289(+)|eukprot:CAMPEP_0196590730 /NCGR_PEP_ID=MMETSP1081-20130531/67369_1 /TAXON_ID=36882 /ORGANISM="Pyramimonas amylifera, Strain CCMP720" /LENGTH=394 /DNA_ID=CAMNT_0041913907 /DNA_START=104 /DNA_END=1288 /DNA_ORIENTATION=-
MSFCLFIFVLALFSGRICLAQTVNENTRCNGRADLCDRPIAQVAFAGAHNAFANEANNAFVPLVENQKLNLIQQLNDGVRMFTLDIYNDAGVVKLCHGSCLLGSVTFESRCDIFVDFFQNSPNEVIVWVVEDYALPSDIVDVMNRTGLSQYAYSLDPSLPTPTLREMVAAGKQLVFISEDKSQCAGQPEGECCECEVPSWYLYRHEGVLQETEWSWSSLDAMNCNLLRGEPTNPLFLINHWLEAGLSGSYNVVLENDSNKWDVLQPRVQKCWEEQNKFPNIVMVDHYHVGDVLMVVDWLNDYWNSSIPFNIAFPKPEISNVSHTNSPTLTPTSTDMPYPTSNDQFNHTSSPTHIISPPDHLDPVESTSSSTKFFLLTKILSSIFCWFFNFVNLS